MDRLLGRVADISVLTEAWEDLLASDREDGVLKAGVSRFAADAREKLAEISADVTAGTYRPSRLGRGERPRRNGRPRPLHVPCVRDRVLERAVLTAIGPYIDPW